MVNPSFLNNTWTLALIQDDGGPPLSTPGTSTGTPSSDGVTGADGANGATTTQSSPYGGMELMIPIFLMLGIVMIWSLFRQRKEQKKRDEMLNAIRKRDRVQTVGGIIGSVVEIKGNSVILKVDESSNTRMTFARSAIQQVLQENPDREEDDATTTAMS